VLTNSVVAANDSVTVPANDSLLSLSYIQTPLSYEEYRRQLAITPTKRDYVDEYRMEMDKYRFKWQKYLFRAGEQNITDECDYGCAQQCFNGTNETTAAELIFFNCLAPKCHCIRHLLSKKNLMDLQYEMLNSTNEIQFLKEEIVN
jgi:hypothetical protein